jgi:hypothetical protein
MLHRVYTLYTLPSLVYSLVYSFLSFFPYIYSFVYISISLPVKLTIDQKQLDSVESFKYLGSMLTKDGRCTCEIKSKIAMAKAAFNKKRTRFTIKMDLELSKKLVKCYVWCIALYDAETWTLRAIDQNTWKVLKCGAGEGWRKSVGPIM